MTIEFQFRIGDVVRTKLRRQRYDDIVGTIDARIFLENRKGSEILYDVRWYQADGWPEAKTATMSEGELELDT